MDIKTINASISVCGQVTADQMRRVADLGFRSVVCNRPDGEGADQPDHDQIEAAARAAGLEYRYLPVISGKVTDEDAEAFASALADLPKPVFAYCRTGTRCATLWSLAQAGTLPVAEIMAAAAAAGYDMAGVAGRLAARSAGVTPDNAAADRAAE